MVHRARTHPVCRPSALQPNQPPRMARPCAQQQGGLRACHGRRHPCMLSCRQGAWGWPGHPHPHGAG
eukprot:40086-Eustigmatos_ZCMA.PRE.1